MDPQMLFHTQLFYTVHLVHPILFGSFANHPCTFLHLLYIPTTWFTFTPLTPKVVHLISPEAGWGVSCIVSEMHDTPLLSN